MHAVPPTVDRPRNRRLPFGADASSALRAITTIAIVVLGAAAIAEIVLRARVMLYSGDEIYNLDAALNLLRRGDYTTWQFGGMPFDPAISSGILATWVQGVTMAAGTSLYAARITTGLLHLVAINALAYFLLRNRGFDRRAAVLTALCVWLALLPVTAHDLRIINPGELWGFTYLAVGVALLASRTRRPGRSSAPGFPTSTAAPMAAAFCWGLSVWLCKTIYAPFAAVLLLAAWLGDTAPGRSHGGSKTAAAARLTIAFVAPLLAWMGLIWLRYDFATVVGWTFSNVAFVVRHATGHALDVGALPVLPGWRFEPQWPEVSFLRMGPNVTIRSLVPLGLGPAARVVHALLARRGRLDVATDTRRVLDLTCAIVIAFAIWFLGFDPTQWGRHLLPAIYVSVAVALYCTADIVTGLRPPIAAADGRRGSRVVELLAAVALASAVGYAGYTSIRSDPLDPWRPSYAKTCHASGELLQPPCTQERAREILAELTRDICGYADRAFDQQCMREHGDRFFARAVEVSNTDSGNPTWVYTGAYILLFVEGWAYRSEERFLDDIAPALCSQPNPLFRQYLEQAGIDVDRVLSRCGRVPGRPQARARTIDDRRRGLG